MLKIQLLLSLIGNTLPLNLNYFISQFSPPLALVCTLGFLFSYFIGVNFLTISSQILSHVMRDSARLLAFRLLESPIVAITMFVSDDSFLLGTIHTQCLINFPNFWI